MDEHKSGQDRRGFPPPTQPAAETSHRVLERNIGALIEARKQAEERRGAQERVADAITHFTGSMTFVYLHIAIIGGWVLANVGLFGLRPFDPFPFGLLTMIGSLEAIFLSTFVLISQNRMMAASERRAELDLQVSLLAEHEITQILTLLDAVARRVGVTWDALPAAAEAEQVGVGGLEESKREIDPVAVLEAIESRTEGETGTRESAPPASATGARDRGSK